MGSGGWGPWARWGDAVGEGGAHVAVVTVLHGWGCGGRGSHGHPPTTGAMGARRPVTGDKQRPPGGKAEGGGDPTETNLLVNNDNDKCMKKKTLRKPVL